MSTPFVYLRNKISGKTTEHTPDEAARILEHPILGKAQEKVDSKRDKVRLTRDDSETAAKEAHEAQAEQVVVFTDEDAKDEKPSRTKKKEA